jgi:hypothetical protein
MPEMTDGEIDDFWARQGRKMRIMGLSFIAVGIVVLVLSYLVEPLRVLHFPGPGLVAIGVGWLVLNRKPPAKPTG